MSNHNIHLELDPTVRDIEYCRLENITFEPNTNSFQFAGGVWASDRNNFPIDDDDILDLMIIVTGNPGVMPVLSVKLDGGASTDHNANEVFSNNGRTFFSLKIPVT